MRWIAWLLLAGCAGLASAQPGYSPPDDQAQALRVARLLYLAETADPYSALAYQRRFSPAQLAGGDLAPLRIKLAAQAEDYGLLERAAAGYRRDLTPSFGYERRNSIWFDLAQKFFARGDYAQAQSAFDNIFGAVPETMKKQLPPFEARLLIARDRNQDAVELLRKWQRKRIRDPFTRYNLAVALARSGEQQEAVGELNEIGTLRTGQPDRLAMRDQANLVLGFGYLEIGQGATARALFQRIRLDGPYSSKALLGLGWAELAPDGERQKLTLVQTVHCVEDPARLLPDNLPVLRRVPREACGPPQVFRDTDKLKTEQGGDTEAERYRNALVPWLELIKRDPRLGAVQEALVAVPYAYAKIGASELAEQYYANAIRLLQPALDSVNFAVQKLSTPPADDAVLPPAVAPDRDWFAQRWGLYTAADAPFFAQVLTDEQFRIAAQSLQDLLVLRDQLITNTGRRQTLRAQLSGRRTALARAGISLPRRLFEEQQRLDTVARDLDSMAQRLDSAIDALGEYLRLQALAIASEHRRRLQNYLTTARIGRANLAEISTAQGSLQGSSQQGSSQ